MLLQVHTAPTFDEVMPSTVEVVDGESASVTCLARGKPRPQYSWIRSNNDLNLASTGHSTVNENTGTLSCQLVLILRQKTYITILKIIVQVYLVVFGNSSQ